MKKILIFSHALELGGAERALLGLLDSIDQSKYSVDLFLMRHQGDLLEYIPEYVNLLPVIPSYAALAVPFHSILKPGTLCAACGRFIGKRKARKKVHELGLQADNGVALEYSHKYTLPFMPMVSDTEYDLAVSFLTPHYFVANRVRAKKKAAWIHTDYSAIDLDTKSEFFMWNAYDYIVSISASVSKSFLQKFPKLQEKMVEIGNILPETLIRRQADAFMPILPGNDSIKLLSVGRYCKAKNFDNVPDICAKIRAGGMNVQWFLIGFGGEEERIRRKIAESGMENHVILLGKKSNPYPYLKHCDLYVQPSRYEGQCVAVREAQLLGKPVVITNYATAQSQLADGVDGVVVPMDNEGCANGILRVLCDHGLRARLIENCRKKDFTNRQEIKKFYQMI